jgi:membrane protein implicated in regulation of membrane protease activity
MAELLPAALPLLLFVAGIGLTAAEALIPGAHFIVVGVALLVAGLLGMLVPLLASPIALAGTTLLAGAAVFYVYREFDLYGGERGVPRDSDSMKGSRGVVVEAVDRSDGRVELDDGGFSPVYSARSMGETIPEGEEVIVLDPGGGNVLTVTAVDGQDGIDRELARERAEAERAREREREDAA